MIIGQGEDLLRVHCRYCGDPVALLYEGTLRKGRTWHVRYRVIEAAGTEVQRPHRCRRYARRAQLVTARNKTAGNSADDREECAG